MTDVRGLVRTTRSAATFCLGVSLIANVFLASSMLDDLNLMLMVGVIALSFAASTGSSRVIGILLFGSSIALLLHSQAPLDVWKQALRENSYLIAMFVLVPLLSIPVAAWGIRRVASRGVRPLRKHRQPLLRAGKASWLRSSECLSASRRFR